jgi:hypothetical protein
MLLIFGLARAHPSDFAHLLQSRPAGEKGTLAINPAGVTFSGGSCRQPLSNPMGEAVMRIDFSFAHMPCVAYHPLACP